MSWRIILPALAAVAFASSPALAQSKDEDQSSNIPQKLRDKLTAEGYQDVKIAPGSYIVSAKDKDGHRVMMMIGPTSMTMMKVPDNPSGNPSGNPSTAQVPGNKDEIIQQ